MEVDKDRSISLTAAVPQVHSRYLPMHIVNCDGGEYGAEYLTNNVLKNDTSVYCTVKQRNVNLLFQYRPQDPGVVDAQFWLTSFTIKAPSKGFTAPLREGLVFVSDKPITPELTAHFDNFTSSKYREWKHRHLDDEGNMTAFGPVGYFKLSPSTNYSTSQCFVKSRRLPRPSEDQPQQWISSPTKLRGRYVLVKLLRSDRFTDVDLNDVLDHPSRGNNIDVQFLGFKGYAGQRSIAYAQLN